MKIEEYILDENFEQNAQQTLKNFEQASSRLTYFEEAIKSKQRGVDIHYYKAYYDYIKADDEHMKTFLHFIKICYDNCKMGKNMMFISKSKVEYFGDIQKRTEAAFDKYYKYYTKLSDMTKKLNEEIKKYNPEDIKKNWFVQFKLQVFVMAVDESHASLANEIEAYRNNEILPILKECDDLFNFDDDKEVKVDVPQYLN